MGRHLKLKTGFDSNRDVLLDEGFDQLTLQEEWSSDAVNILEFTKNKSNANKRTIYEF